MTSIDRRIVDLHARLAAKEVELKRLRTKLINDVGQLHTAKQLRDADLDDFVTDASELCRLKVEVTELLKSMQQLGSA